MGDRKLDELRARALRGGEPKYHEKNREQGKLFARERIGLLLDSDSFVEDGLYARCDSTELPADGVVTGTGRLSGRPIAVMANDSTVKAGSWGPLTVEKILRLQETAARLRCPVVYLVDSAGARLTDQARMFPGRRGAGRIFYNEVQLSGVIPQLCVLFGPSAAGGAYIPAFCDFVIMVEGNAAMYLGSPRMAEMVIGEKVSLEDMGGARMHCTVSGCGDYLAATEEQALEAARTYLSYLPSHAGELPPSTPGRAPQHAPESIDGLIPSEENKAFDMRELLLRVVDEGSWFEHKALFAREILTGFARLEGRVVAVVANQPKHLGGVLFPDSANKAARFMALADAFNIPLLFFADVPGFMIGSKVERQGIIRAGAKMLAAMSEANVPRISVIVRKAYGAGLYAMCGPGFEPDACLALPSASIAVMGAEAAVNAVYYNKIQAVPEGPERDAYVAQLRAEYRADVDLFKLASDLVVDAVIQPAEIRHELSERLKRIPVEAPAPGARKHLILPM